MRTVAVTVTDQGHALGFYRETLGFEVRLDRDAGPMRWIEVAPVGAAVSIALTAGERDQAVTESGIRFTVPDAAIEHQDLIQRGVEVGELLRWPGVPPMFSFNDPDGNQFVIIANQGERTVSTALDHTFTATLQRSDSATSACPTTSSCLAVSCSSGWCTCTAAPPRCGGSCPS